MTRVPKPVLPKCASFWHQAGADDSVQSEDKVF